LAEFVPDGRTKWARSHNGNGDPYPNEGRPCFIVLSRRCKRTREVAAAELRSTHSAGDKPRVADLFAIFATDDEGAGGIPLPAQDSRYR